MSALYVWFQFTNQICVISTLGFCSLFRYSVPSEEVDMTPRNSALYLTVTATAGTLNEPDIAAQQIGNLRVFPHFPHPRINHVYDAIRVITIMDDVQLEVGLPSVKP